MRKNFLEWDSDHRQLFFDLAVSFGAFQISQEDFEEWQQLLRKAMITLPKEWEKLKSEFDPKKVMEFFRPLPIQFDWKSDPPIARLAVRTALDAIIASVQLDALQGTRFRLCAGMTATALLSVSRRDRRFSAAIPACTWQPCGGVERKQQASRVRGFNARKAASDGRQEA